MGKRGPKPKERPSQVAKVAVSVAEPEQEASVVAEPEKQPEIVTETKTAINDCWRYHATEEKRIFRAGEVIPAGWEDTPAKFAKE
jgi:hypothetical protein